LDHNTEALMNPTKLTKTIALSALAALMISTGASAQEMQQPPAAPPAPKPVGFQDWQLFCPDAAPAAEVRVCEIRTIMAGEDGRNVGALVVAAVTQPKTNDSEIIASALVPLGVDLTMDPSLRIDEGEPVELNFVRCLQRGCEAMRPLSASQQASMQSGSKAKLAVGVGHGQHAVLEFSLKGFTAALAEMKQRTGAK
jgi:invasion protein IalB